NWRTAATMTWLRCRNQNEWSSTAKQWLLPSSGYETRASSFAIQYPFGSSFRFRAPHGGADMVDLLDQKAGGATGEGSGRPSGRALGGGRPQRLPLDVLWLPVDVQVQPAEVFAHDAQREQLQPAQHQ